MDPTKINAHWLGSALGQSERRKGTLPSLLPDPIKISPPRLPNFLTFQLSTILIAYAQIPPDLNAVVDTSVAFFRIAIAALMMKFYRFEMRPR